MCKFLVTYKDKATSEEIKKIEEFLNRHGNWDEYDNKKNTYILEMFNKELSKDINTVKRRIMGGVCYNIVTEVIPLKE